VVAALTPGSHQLVDWTAPNRYPEIFAAAAAAAPDAAAFSPSAARPERNAYRLPNISRKPKSSARHQSAQPREGLEKAKRQNSLHRCQRPNPEQARRIGCSSRRWSGPAAYWCGLLVMHNSMYRFSDTAHRGSYDRIPVAAKHDKGLFLPDGVTEVEPDSCLWRKREP
jgi:hypothetical protein